MSRWAVLGISCAAFLAAAQPALSMQFRRVELDPGRYAIVAEGPIVTGDQQRLLDFVNVQPPTDLVGGFFLDSPGGDVFEAEKLATAFLRMNVKVGVVSGQECVSACFLIFAAARYRVAAEDALIGVHSVASNGAENLDTMGLTTAFARDLAGYGIPAAIIGKLVSTQPNRVEWLTEDDLRSMNVSIVAAAATSPSTTPAVAPPPIQPSSPEPMTAMAPVVPTIPPLPPQQPSQPAAFQQGLADRQAYEKWFNGLDGEYQAGAFYWSGQRSLRNPGTCYTGTPGFVQGCLVAQRMLALSDYRRHTEPDYRAGWNSF